MPRPKKQPGYKKFEPIFVRIDPKLYDKATKLKRHRGQSWVTYIEGLIRQDKRATLYADQKRSPAA